MFINFSLYPWLPSRIRSKPDYRSFVYQWPLMNSLQNVEQKKFIIHNLILLHGSEACNAVEKTQTVVAKLHSLQTTRVAKKVCHSHLIGYSSCTLCYRYVFFSVISNKLVVCLTFWYTPVGKAGSGTSETKHWSDMITKPRQTVVQWHRLKPEWAGQPLWPLTHSLPQLLLYRWPQDQAKHQALEGFPTAQMIITSAKSQQKDDKCQVLWNNSRWLKKI